MKMSKPFVKWAGGKYRLASQLIKKLPKNFNPEKNCYFEPMVGSGGFFFKYGPKNYYLSDINPELIITFNVIKKPNVNKLISTLQRYKDLHNEKYYKKQREKFNVLKTKRNRKNYDEIAALFIYLNRTCFNGLYRENSKGEFNVPIGSYTNPLICDKDNLLSVNKTLKNKTIRCHDYRRILPQLKPGDFVYIDPPYIPINLASFTKYSKNDFGEKDHKKLDIFCNNIEEKGAYFMLSNSDTKKTREIYLREGRFSKKFKVSRTIASKAKNRVKAKELIITNYEI